MQDLWLRADYPIGPFAQAPVDQAVADVLAKAPWSAWSTGEVPFRLQLVDRPEAGTAFLALLHPSQQRPTSVPPDGLRYLVAEPNERRTLTRHAVSCPTSLANPTQHQTLQVELECLTSACGHLPPLAPDQPLALNSPDQRLTRFRKRWRITNGQNPSLWFFWWGRDESGGMGQGSAPTAPPGWGNTPVRQYPLQRPPNAPTQPLFPFPSPNRMPPGTPSAAAAPSPAPPPPGLVAATAAAAAARPPPGTPQARAPFAQFPQQPGPGGGLGTPQQQAALAAASAATPYARQQQLAQLVANASASQAQGVGAGGAQGAALEARQAQYQQQQQAAAAAAAAAAGRGAPPSVLAGGPGQYGVVPAPVPHAQGMGMSAQQLQAQQQQAYLVAQQRAHAQAQAQAHAHAQVPHPQRRPTMPPPSSSSRLGHAPAHAHAHGPAPAPLAYDDTLFTDVLDLVSPRQLALHRLSTAHDLVQPLFDSPWSARDVLAGAPRTRDMLDVLGTVGVSRSTGEARPGAPKAVVPGLGRDGPLGECANAAARIAVRGAMGVGAEEAGAGGVEERRRRLEGLLRETEEGIRRMEEQHEGRMGRKGAAVVSPAA
ncbi:hypothetical protein JCM9279_001340 [Rhodotorula babjevae]